MAMPLRREDRGEAHHAQGSMFRGAPLTSEGREVLARLCTACLRPSLPKPPAGEEPRLSEPAFMRRASPVLSSLHRPGVKSQAKERQ